MGGGGYIAISDETLKDMQQWWGFSRACARSSTEKNATTRQAEIEPLYRLIACM